jgi:TonB-dependent receptor
MAPDIRANSSGCIPAASGTGFPAAAPGRRRPLAILALAFLCCAFSATGTAQEPGPGKQPETATVEGRGEEPGERRRRAQRELPAEDGELLEEVMVLADRIEGSGGRRRADADRNALDRSDQTDMEGFFDEIDGLSTLGGDDEGNRFSIDGLSPDLGKVTLNGQGFGEGRGNGGLGAGDLPPDMILRVDVFKTPTAAMEEGGVSGRVNLQLRNPVDITGPSASFKGRLAYVPDTDALSPSASYFLGRRSEGGKSGYMLSVNWADRATRRDSQDISNWLPREFDGTTSFMPSQVRNSAVDTDQGSLFAGLTMGFKPLESLDINVRVMFADSRRDTQNDSLQHRFERQRDISALEFDERIATALESADARRENLRISGNLRQDRIETLILGLEANWRHEGWRIQGATGYEKVDNVNDPPTRTVQFEANSAFGYRVNADGSLSTDYPEGLPASAEFAASRINLSDRRTEDTNAFGAVDVTRQLGDGFLRRVRFGAKIRDTTRNRDSAKGRLTLDEPLSLPGFSRGSLQTPWDAVAWPAVDPAAIDALLQGEQAAWEDNLLNEYDVERRTDAAYLQADFRATLNEERFLVGNIGARVVSTDTRVAGYQSDGDAIVPIAVNTAYNEFLPSLTTRMRIAARAALTLGAARVMVHPSFNDLAPGVRLDHAEKTAKSGNPNLEPFRATQFLAEATWVPERGRRLTGSLIYRDVESYFALGEESVEIDDETYRLTRPINGEKGHILTAGVKLDQNLRRIARRLQNFSLGIAYTRNRSGTDLRDPYSGETLPLPNTAEYVARCELAYDRQAFAGKLSYQWRGKSLKSSSSESGLSVWNQQTGSLNLNLGWRLTEKMQFTLDARNLLNEEQIQTTDFRGQLWRFSERHRSLAATLRAKW